MLKLVRAVLFKYRRSWKRKVECSYFVFSSSVHWCLCLVCQLCLRHASMHFHKCILGQIWIDYVWGSKSQRLR